jgi:hypothetical protein
LPKKPGPLLEIPLVDVERVEVDRSLLKMMFRNPQVSRRLRIPLKDGRRIDFHSPVAMRWRRYINRALATQQQSG